MHIGIFRKLHQLYLYSMLASVLPQRLKDALNKRFEYALDTVSLCPEHLSMLVLSVHYQ